MSANPPTGSHIAKREPDCRLNDALVAAVVLTVRVEVPEPPDTEAGLKEQVGDRVPAGATLHVKFTVPVKPLAGVMVMVEVALPPAETEVGESAVAAMPKSLTLRLSVVVCTSNPAVPLMVTLAAVTGVEDEVFMVSVEVTVDPAGVTDAGANEQEAPPGRPEVHARTTGVTKPPRPVTAMV
jgi:hypothetical protein